MHLHKNEVDLGSLQPLVWRSLRQQLPAPIPWLLPLGPPSVWDVVEVFIPWGGRLVLPFLLLLFLCVSFLSTTVLITDLCNCYSYCCFYMFFFCIVVKILIRKKNRNHNSYRFSYKIAFIFFLCFLTNQKQESGFQRVGGLVTKNIFIFCL